VIVVLRDNPLVLLFTVAAAGYLLGRVRIGGVRLGVAAVLFTGLGVGAVDPSLRLPEVVYLLGLVLFVYTVGLSSGPGFFHAFSGGGRDGLRDNAFAVAVLVLAAGLAVAAHHVLAVAPATAAGVFAGSLTNTPALAGALDYLKAYAPRAALEQMLVEPVVGYSITYPMGVAGSIVAIHVARRLWPVDHADAAARLRQLGVPAVRLDSRTIRVTQPQASQQTVQELIGSQGWDVVFGRIKRAGRLFLATGRERLAPGDLVSVVGTAADLDRVTARLGHPSSEKIDLDRSEYDYRRILVSDPRVAGRRLKDLVLPQRFGAVVTRVKRGDAEFVPHGDTMLELGDRIRVLTARHHLDEVSAFFGDSYRAISEIDVMSFSLGLAAGLLLGLVPIPLPGGLVIKLGFAGGPLVVALVLGALERTGPLVWNIPYGANLTLRQIGLILFLAGIGTRAGYTFVQTLAGGGGAVIFLAGAFITAAVAVAALWIGRRALKIPMGMLLGMYAGIQTQPAALAFAAEQTGDDLPGLGYARVYPVAIIGKILLAQVLLLLLM
jgi:putative transport protein